MTPSDIRHAARGGHSLSKRDWAIIACGALVFVASFLPWEAATSGGLGAGYTGSASAWNAGFAAWFGSLLCAAAAAVVVVRHLGYAVGFRGIGPNIAVCGLTVAGVVLLTLRLLTLPRGGNYGVLGSGSYGYGPSFGAFAGVAFGVVQAVVALLNVRASGERMPSLSQLGTSAPARQPGPGPGHVRHRQPGQPGYGQPDGFRQPGSPAYGQPDGRGHPDGYGPSDPPAFSPADGYGPADHPAYSQAGGYHEPAPAEYRQPGPGQPASPGSGSPRDYDTRRRPSPSGGQEPPPPVPAAAPPWSVASAQPASVPRQSAPGSPAHPQPYEDQDLAQRLSRLDDLRARGMISDAEYSEQRRRIISQL